MKQTLNGTHTKQSKKSMSAADGHADIQEGTRSDEQMKDTFAPQEKSSMARDSQTGSTRNPGGNSGSTRHQRPQGRDKH